MSRKEKPVAVMLGLPWGNSIGDAGHNIDHPAMTVAAAEKRAQGIIDAHEKLGRPIERSDIELIPLIYAMWFVDADGQILNSNGDIISYSETTETLVN